jgi:rhodanese-related sulfurtransferase
MTVSFGALRVSLELFFEFIAQQWVLVAALAVTLTMLAMHESRKAGPALSITEAVRLVNSEGGVFLDVRDAGEFARGHITDALNIPLAALSGRSGELEKFREKPIIVVCKMGQSAGSAAKTLKAQGFAGASKLAGGMMEWDAQKLPVVTR